MTPIRGRSAARLGDRVEAEDPHRPGVRPAVALAGLDGGGLARAVGAEHGGDGAPRRRTGRARPPRSWPPYRFTRPTTSTAGSASHAGESRERRPPSVAGVGIGRVPAAWPGRCRAVRRGTAGESAEAGGPDAAGKAPLSDAVHPGRSGRGLLRVEELRNNGVVKKRGDGHEAQTAAAPAAALRPCPPRPGPAGPGRAARHAEQGRPLHPRPRPVHRRRARAAAGADPGGGPPPSRRARRARASSSPARSGSTDRVAGAAPPRSSRSRTAAVTPSTRPTTSSPRTPCAGSPRPPAAASGARPRSPTSPVPASPRRPSEYRARAGGRRPRSAPRALAEALTAGRVRCHGAQRARFRPASSSASTTARWRTPPSSSRSCARRRPRSSPACSAPMCSGWPPSPMATGCARPSSRRRTRDPRTSGRETPRRARAAVHRQHGPAPSQ